MKKHALQVHQSFTDPNKIEYWDSLYEQQDFFGESFRQRMSTALSWFDEFNITETSKILDAGCGAGRLVKEVSKLRYNTIGMDFSYGMLVKAKSICGNDDEGNSAFCQGTIELLPLNNSSFDVIICLGVITYLKSEHKAISEFARVLKPGGILIISFFNKARLVSHLDLPQMSKSIFRRIIKTGNKTSHAGNEKANSTKLTTYYIPEIQKSLEMEGFTVLEYTTIPAELFTLFGREVFPREMTLKITHFFERFSNIPFIGSFGGMCIFKAVKLPPAIE